MPIRPSVPAAASSMARNSPDGLPSIAVNSLDQELTGAIQAALSRAHISNRLAAQTMGLDPAQWSRQLHGPEHPSLRRMLKLGPAFWQEFVPVLAQICDAPYGTDPRWTLLIELVRAIFAGVSPLPGRAKMAKSVLPAAPKEQAR